MIDHDIDDEAPETPEPSREERMEELAKLGLAFKSDSLMVHFLILIGREDDEAMKAVQDRRIATANMMDALAEALGVEP